MRAFQIAEGINQVGFKRWYERQLMSSFGCLVSAFLALILAVVMLEVYAPGHVEKYLLSLPCLMLVGLWMRSYMRGLGLAERLAGVAACPHCGKYGSFRVLDSGPAGAERLEETPAELWLRARCGKCAREWLI